MNSLSFRDGRELSEAQQTALVSLVAEVFAPFDRIPDERLVEYRARLKSFYFHTPQVQVIAACQGDSLVGGTVSEPLQNEDLAFVKAALRCRDSYFSGEPGTAIAEVMKDAISAYQRALFGSTEDIPTAFYSGAIQDALLTDRMKIVTIVDPKYQRNGVARNLDEHIQMDAREKGAERLFSTTVKSRPMYRINLAAGYEVIATFPRFYSPEDMVLMGKTL